MSVSNLNVFFFHHTETGVSLVSFCNFTHESHC